MVRTYRIRIEVEDFSISEVLEAKNLREAIEKAKGVQRELEQYYKLPKLRDIDEVIAQ